jgi:tetratricopeptide (TPR) repeat protein
MKILVVCFLVASLAAVGAQTGNLGGSLAGVVRDEQGAAIAGAEITVASATSQARFTTTSDAQGAYHFVSLPTGEYRLEITRDGFAASQPISVSIAIGAVVAMPIMLKRLPPTHPQFEAAGVRGLIDPGGYSASSNAATASSLIKGVADIQRTGDHATTPAINTSCALEPALKQDAEQKPESASASLELGEFYLAHGQEAKALPALEHARSLDNNDQETLEQLADAYLQARRFDAARQLLTSAKIQETSEIYRLLARADEVTGRFTEASHAYQLAADRDPSQENLFGAGYELILAGLPRDAEQAFAGAVKRAPQSIQLLIGLGSAQFLEGRTTESIQTLLRAVDLDPADPRPYPFLSGAASTGHDEAKRVEAAFERFLNVAPDDPRASYYLALEMLHEPARDEVTYRSRIEALLKRAILLDPGLADAHFQLGVLYGRQENYQAVAEELNKALSISPDLMEAHYRLAIAYRQTGHMDLSAKEMQRFRELQERSPAQKAGMGVDIDQFISVLGKPRDVPARGSVCPGDSQ